MHRTAMHGVLANFMLLYFTLVLLQIDIVFNTVHVFRARPCENVAFKHRHPWVRSTHGVCNFTESTRSPGDMCREDLRFKLPEGTMYHHQTANVVSISSRVNPVTTGVREGGLWGGCRENMGFNVTYAGRQKQGGATPKQTLPHARDR